MRHSAHAITTAIVIVALGLSGCSNPATPEVAESDIPRATESAQSVEELLTASHLKAIDHTKWQYNAQDDVYWQTGLQYASKPADPQQATLGVYVPGKFMQATQNPDGTFTATVNLDATVGNFTGANAPWILPVNTPGYSAITAPTGYVSDAKAFTDQGMVYVVAGARGRDNGAPAGVTDLKAAIRYVRANADHLAGDATTVYVYGMSGGGGQGAILGASGDSELYTPYLQAIGAANGVSDAITGVMAWCPITSLDYANEAYEWQFGAAREGLEEGNQELSNGLAEAFATHLNNLQLTDSSGQVLSLKPSSTGIFQAGSYYQYLKTEIENSLNTFLGSTTFPTTVPARQGPGGGQPPGGTGAQGDGPPGAMTGQGHGNAGPTGASSGASSGSSPGASSGGNGQGDGVRHNKPSSGLDLTGKTFANAEAYIAALNANGQWVTYDAATQRATITSIKDFVRNMKAPTKDVGAFDALDASQPENVLFGYGDGKGAHFDPTMAALLESTQYADDYNADLTKTDGLGTPVGTRMNMYNPMYYLNRAYQGYESSKVAPKWRIRSGISQSDTALSVETNLALALSKYSGVNEVDFAAVWGQGHTMAELTGDPIENFINWVKAQESQE